jgi:DNA-binding transcriptional ArsR family regulator
MSERPDGLPSWVDPKTTTRLDATSIRGLAHPTRLRMLGILRSEGPATATTLAARLGSNTGATSYHLRQLAAHGFIVEDETLGSARERWWRAAHRTTFFDRDSMGGDDGGEAYVRALAQIYAERILRAVDDHATLPPEWRDAGTLSDAVLRLTPDEARRLREELLEVTIRYRRHDPEDTGTAPEDAVPVSVQIQSIPHAHPMRSARDQPGEDAG